MSQTAIIMGTVGQIDDSVPTTIERISEASYDGVELGVRDYDFETVVETLDTVNLSVTSIMTGLDHIREPKDELLETCRALDCKRVVLGYLDESYFKSPTATAETAKLLNECAAVLDDHGLDLCYHNHDHEFTSFGDRTAFDILLEHLDEDIEFEIDVGWVGVGGENPVAVLERHGDRVPLVHFKDMVFETGDPVALGEGDLDVETVAKTAAEQGVEWLVYEDERDSDGVEKMHHGSRELAKLTVRGGDAR
ncbi:sugar phosphate isomerase/epimerase family protein [Halorussus salinisoli]|uniref:sugar phosphate isomerase/epimerase family protein n=1 Tax=Halorussus salinisoli TaxID=2558242 RepID=UPI0010C176A9|nr:sugar phosphate isomerase/epimerase [Halorussus salinisoli]